MDRPAEYEHGVVEEKIEMARGLNKVQIIGNLGRDREMKYTPNGKAVTQFSVGVNGSQK